MPRMVIDFLPDDEAMLKSCGTAHELQRAHYHLTDDHRDDWLTEVAARGSYVRAAWVAHEIGLDFRNPVGQVAATRLDSLRVLASHIRYSVGQVAATRLDSLRVLAFHIRYTVGQVAAMRINAPS